MPRVVTVTDLRANISRELDDLRDSADALYVSRGGRSIGVLLNPARYAELIERLDYLEDSLAARQAREDDESSLRWSDVRA